MSYVDRLIHSADVFHHTTSVDPDTKQRVPGYPDEGDDQGVCCLLIEGFPETAQREFGRELDADAVIYFPSEQDIRPKPGSSGGQGDKIVVTDDLGVESTWIVLAAFDPGTQRRGVRAAVRGRAK